MSKVAFFCIPAWGHTNPTVEVVRELTARGHQVRYYSFLPFAEKLEAAGAEVVLCDSYLPPQPEDLDKKVGKDFALLIEMIVDTTLAMEGGVYQDLKLFMPDVIVSDSVSFWGKLFARKLRIPYVCSTTTFAFNQHSAQKLRPNLRETLRLVLGMRRVNKKVNLLARNGYPVKNFLELVQNDNETDTIVYTSRKFQPDAETFSERYAFVGPSLPEMQAEERMKVRPLIYISLGTVVNKNPAFYKNSFSALRDMEVDVILSVGENVEISDTIPENFKVEKHVDQLSVLRKADVFLTHCGMNSVSEAIWFGVPMIFYPQQSEESAVADRAEELGTGIRLNTDAPRVIRQAIETALAEHSRYHEAALEIRKTFIAAGGARAAAEKIESMIPCEK